MTYSNSYTDGQIWAQALARGRSLLHEMEGALATRRFGRSIARYEEVGSTNTIAASWAAAGASEGALVVADHQVRGRGRHGRAWTDAPGTNLMFSVILRPTLPLDRFGLVMLAACSSVAEAVATVDASLPVSIKWPNDVLIRDRKCCGLLMETSGPSAPVVGRTTAVVGIGINVNQDEFPDNFALPATSLALECGRLIDRPALLASILNGFEPAYEKLATDGGASVRETYLRRLESLGAYVRVYSVKQGDAIEGRVAGISPIGALLLETDEGLRTLTSGEVTFHRDQEA